MMTEYDERGQMATQLSGRKRICNKLLYAQLREKLYGLRQVLVKQKILNNHDTKCHTRPVNICHKV